MNHKKMLKYKPYLLGKCKQMMEIFVDNQVEEVYFWSIILNLCKEQYNISKNKVGVIKWE